MQLTPRVPRITAATGAVLALVLVLFAEAGAAAPELPSSVRRAFQAHYQQRLGPLEERSSDIAGTAGTRYTIRSELLRGEGNYPSILYHGKKTTDVIVLIHGLSDSPFYMEAIGRAFYAAGLNVVLPLLDAHGLVDPDRAMEDEELAEKWKATTDHAVTVARMLGDRVSIGGLSTGGALSVNKALRDPAEIDGGVFLYSAALNVGTMNQLAGRSLRIMPMLARKQDGDYRGNGPNPYKYPRFTLYGGLQLTRIIRENQQLLEKGSFTQPTFAAHSLDDTAALVKGIGDLFRAHKGTAIGIVLALDPPVEHASLVLAEDVALDPTMLQPGEELPPTPKANPVFPGMMDLSVAFLQRYVQHQPRER